MNSREFRTEIHNYIDEVYDRFEDSKRIITEMFNVFHNICMNNDFTYYYGFGSLLGIVRDGGMIPWDADIDVLVPVNRMELLLSILKKDLPSDYYVISNFNQNNYYLCESRICCKKYDPEYYHIDIFYLIGAPDNDNKRLKFDNKIKKTYYLRALRFQPLDKGDSVRDNLVFYTKMLIRLLLKIEPDCIFNYRCKRLLFKYDYSSSNYCIVWAVGGEIFPIKIFEPVSIFDNDVLQCYLPHDPDTFLKIRYNNYMEYLPIQDRFDEFYSGYKRFCKGDNGG